ncbi:uncharacterized protein BKCO1_24000105 [Diplodia corticola]|uniref:Gpi anchored protein n=1 Tax=Diplodia corticola TaxID=236234 RepID=A0A1J9R222_9PEZI|nr:uncharacterized protein BKCO1_24000105 [Diplodia corticola]OJD34290.1 hypothetical protein BKCO1_24000105 [Diplodia corticola]
MISNTALPLLLAALASSAAAAATTTSSVLSFPFVGDGFYTVIPSTGVSGSIVGVDKDARTTLVYECDAFATDVDDFSTVGALCPFATDAAAQTVTFGENYWGQRTTGASDGITAAVDMDCAITVATGASPASAVESPVCTMSFGGDYADELAAIVNCAGGVGEDADDIDTQSALDCLLSPTAAATDVAVVSFPPTNVFYWTVTVTAVADAVLATSTSASQGGSASSATAAASTARSSTSASGATTGSAASASATGDAGNGAAGGAGAGAGVGCVAVAGVVGLAGVVLAL